MSLEHEFSRIATALEAIAAAMKGANTVTPAVQAVQAPKSKPAQEVVAPAAVVPTITVKAEPTPAPAPVAAPQVAPVAPTIPVVAASPAVASPSSPFADGKAVIAYTMTSYKELGPIKGAQIQQILTGLGCVNINELKAENYQQFHDAVEALKVAA